MTKNSTNNYSAATILRSLLINLRRVNKCFLVKISLAILAFLFIWILIISRGHLFIYFSTRCIDYKQKEFSRRLNDRVVDYSSDAKHEGSGLSNNKSELNYKISHGILVKTKSCDTYIVDRMRFSHPVLVPESKELLDEIGRRFREKTRKAGLPGTRIHVTSMTRGMEDLRKLKKYNPNTSPNSPHLYGNAFDISYIRFAARKMVLTSCDTKFMKEALAEVISKLRDEGRCWATYERNQNCFHVVSR